jgi:hypothetical protein
MNFAARLRFPYFATQMRILRVPKYYFDQDAELFRRHPPTLAGVRDGPNSDTLYTGRYVCSLPAIVWRPRQYIEPAYIYPILPLLKDSHPVLQDGRHQYIKRMMVPSYQTN